jgi:hypothetical protein
MKLLNHWITHASIKHGLMAIALATTVAAPAWSARAADAAGDPEAAARANWRAFLRQNPATEEGCHHVSYPSTVWEKVDCITGQPRSYLEHTTSTDAEVVGNTNDYVAKAKGLISSAAGTFTTKGVTSETGIGVAAYHDKGILGSNEYSVQINTNANETTSACDHHSGCTVWQQFFYAPDYYYPGAGQVLMQYWLLNWGSSACPSSSWRKHGADCFINSASAGAPDIPITDLGKIELEATSYGGNDSVTLTYDSESYSVTASSVLSIATVWKETEFNVLGNTGGSRADFNKGSSVTAQLLMADGSTAAPTCVADAGTTGETNNLTLGKCKPSTVTFFGFTFPEIEFTELN